MLKLFISLALIGALAGCGSNGDKPAQDASTADTKKEPPFTDTDLLKACVSLSACDVDRKPRLVDCVENFHKRFSYFGQRKLVERLYRCVIDAAGDCAKVRQCVGFKSRPKNGECDSSYKPKCVGDVAWNCDLRPKGGWEQGLDCSVGGLKCAVKKTGTTTAAICGGGPCEPGKYKNKCVNRQLWTCIGGAIEINDCVEQQLQCRDPNSGGCEGTGRSCRDTSPRCEQDILVKCARSYLTQIDCRKVYGQKKCDNTTIECKGAGGSCKSDSFFDTCNGETLEVCVDGFVKKVNCKALGFLGCEVSGGYGDYCKAKPVYD